MYIGIVVPWEQLPEVISPHVEALYCSQFIQSPQQHKLQGNNSEGIIISPNGGLRAKKSPQFEIMASQYETTCAGMFTVCPLRMGFEGIVQ